MLGAWLKRHRDMGLEHPELPQDHPVRVPVSVPYDQDEEDRLRDHFDDLAEDRKDYRGW